MTRLSSATSASAPSPRNCLILSLQPQLWDRTKLMELADCLAGVTLRTIAGGEYRLKCYFAAAGLRLERAERELKRLAAV